MPLYADGLKKIEKGLLAVQAGMPSPLVKVGRFTEEELRTINDQRVEDDLEPIDGVIVFNGKHMYRSRCLRDGYAIEEVLEQIQSAFGPNGEVSHDGATVIASQVDRTDRRGVSVRDRVVFECSEKKPSPLLWSVVPKGDGRKQK